MKLKTWPGCTRAERLIGNLKHAACRTFTVLLVEPLLPRFPFNPHYFGKSCYAIGIASESILEIS
jgi:hypothetical protein